MIFKIVWERVNWWVSRKPRETLFLQYVSIIIAGKMAKTIKVKKPLEVLI
jgi:hypothetical protein